MSAPIPTVLFPHRTPLSACPVIIGMTLEYLAEGIMVRFDVGSYLALQRGIDHVWAAEARRLMKKGMQLAQAVIARRKPKYVFDHPCMLRNDVFTATIDLQYLSTLDEIHSEIWRMPGQQREVMFFMILMCADNLKGQVAKAQTVYAVVRDNCVVRGLCCGVYEIDTDTSYGMLAAVEHWAGGHNVESYGFALVQSEVGQVGRMGRKEGYVILLGKRDGDFRAKKLYVRSNRVRVGWSSVEGGA
jgi:hypothetical protein